jgi:hypothetical protein
MKKCPRGPRGCVRHIFWVFRSWFLWPCGFGGALGDLARVARRAGRYVF